MLEGAEFFLHDFSGEREAVGHNDEVHDGKMLSFVKHVFQLALVL